MNKTPILLIVAALSILLAGPAEGNPASGLILYSPMSDTTTYLIDRDGEVAPDRLTGGTVVWKWHLWDHLIQHFDSAMDNYGVVRLSDGNTLICDGPQGRFFEVNHAGETVWEFVNPYPSPTANNVFKIRHYSAGYPGLSRLFTFGTKR